MPIKILYIIDSLHGPRAGTERQVLTLIRRLDPRKFLVFLVCLRSSSWSKRTTLTCPSKILNFRSFLGPGFFRCGNQFVSYCRRHEIDIVQTFFRDSNIAGTLWARKAAVPVIISSRRNLGTGYWHNWREVAALRYLTRYTTHYIANSRAAAEEAIAVERLEPGKVSVIPNCLDLEEFETTNCSDTQPTKARWGFSEETLVVGSVTNLRPIKDIPFLIHTAAHFLSRFPQVRFVVLGEGPQRPQLERMIRSQGLEGRFLLPGATDNSLRDIQAFDVFVLCSKAESSSNSLIESMAAGRASIASQVGGNDELLSHGETGYLFPPGDRERLEELLADLISDEQKRTSFGQKAKSEAQKRFDWRVIVPQLEDLYESLARQKKTAG
jgi:glycosyltransferase involved in cell wall biosynthesis